MGQMELRIEGSFEEGWTAQWSLDGVVAGSEIRVGVVDSARLATEGRRFLALFEQGVRPLVEPSVLSSLGAELARIWLDPAREALGTAIGSEGGELVIAGHDARALDLPWELIELHAGLPVGCDAAWTLRREAIADGAARSTVPLPAPGAGPLRILFLTSAPEDQAPLDLEREEDLVLRSTEGLRGEVIVHIAEVGTFDELRRLVGRVKPQVIHLSGHGNINSTGEGVFAFETEEGETDLKTAEQIATAVARGSSVRLFVLNACKSAQAGVAGICRALVAAGVPHALGWAASVEDRVASRFTTTLYGELMTGVPVGRAVAHARLELRDQGVVKTKEGPLLDASFAVSQLYGRGAGELLDFGKPREVYNGPSTEHALLGDGVQGLKEGFIGRRRDVWKVLRAMRRGEPTVAFFWGLGGVGKSTLATRVANRLGDDGFHILPVRVPNGDDPATIGRETHSKLVDAIERAFKKAGREDLLGTLQSEKIAPEQRLRLAVEGLCEIRAFLVLDNLEGSLALETRQIVDPGLAFLVKLLATDLTRGSRLLITCRYEIADLKGLSVLGHEVKDFHSSDVRKFFRRNEKVEERLHRGEIPLWMFDRLATELGGTPRFLEIVRTVLRTMDPEELVTDLDGLESGLLTEKRQEYLEEILAQRLYAALSPAASSLASRLAVSELPLPADGAARTANCGEAEARLALGEGVAYGLIQIFEEADLPTLYYPPGLLRSWLVEKGLGEEVKRDVHANLARFWRETFEEGRERDLRVLVEAVLEACRLHAEAGKDSDSFRWASVKLAEQRFERGWLDLARRLLEVMPDDCRDAATWNLLGTIDLAEGSYREAREKFGRALGIARTAGSLADVASATVNLGFVDLKVGDFVAARARFQQALSDFGAIGDQEGEASVLHQLGLLDAEEGHPLEARIKLERSLALEEKIGNRAGQAATLHVLGSVALALRDYRTAANMLEKALKIDQEFGNKAGEASDLHFLGNIDLEKRAFNESREKFQKALSIRQSVGDRAGEAATWAQLGAVSFRIGRADASFRLTGLAFLILSAIGDVEAKIVERNLGGVSKQLGYGEAEVQTLLAEVWAGYMRDRGWDLLEKAFPEPTAYEPPPPPPL